MVMISQDKKKMLNETKLLSVSSTIANIDLVMRLFRKHKHIFNKGRLQNLI